MKNALFCLLLAIILWSCPGPTPVDPFLTNPLTMSLWVDYTTTPVSLRLRGSTFKNTSGPVETPFDSATVYVSDDRFGTYQTLTVTTQTRLSLATLAPGKTWYLLAKGRVGSYVSSPTGSVMFVPDVLLSTRSLLPYNPATVYYLAPAGFPALRQYTDPATGGNVSQVVDAAGNSRSLTYTNTNGGVFYCRGWDAASQRAFFEISRGNKRALVSYNTANQTFADIPLPAEADVWNYAIAPDGQQIVFTDYKRNGLWLFDTRTNVQKKLDGPQTVYSMSWTSDSRAVLLSGPAQGSVNDSRFVALYDPKTDTQTTIQTGFPAVSNPQLSPDKTYLLFDSNLSGLGNLWVQNLKTGVVRPVAGTYTSLRGWLNDGTFWVANQSSLLKFTPDF